MDIGCTSKPLIARDADIEHALTYLQPMSTCSYYQSINMI